MLAIIIALSIITTLTNAAAILITVRTNRAIAQAASLIRDEHLSDQDRF